MSPPPDSWYQNAVMYSLDVRTFQDSDGDGVGHHAVSKDKPR